MFFCLLFVVFVLRPTDPNVEILIAVNLENEEALATILRHKNALNTKKTKESLRFDTSSVIKPACCKTWIC